MKQKENKPKIKEIIKKENDFITKFTKTINQTISEKRFKEIIKEIKKWSKKNGYKQWIEKEKREENEKKISQTPQKN